MSGLMGGGSGGSSGGILKDIPIVGGLLSKIPIVGPLLDSVFGAVGGEVTPAPEVTSTETPPDPYAINTISDEEYDFAQKDAIKKSSYGKTILTGNLVPKSTGKKKILG